MTRSRSSSTRRCAAVAFITGTVLGASIAAVATASASAAYGTVGTYTTNGINYENQSGVAAPENGYKGYGYSEAATVSGGDVATGWIGVLPRLYLSNGDICAERSDYTYTNTSAASLATGVYGSCGTTYAYYSYGVTKAWNGNGYNAYFTFRTPNVTSY